MLNNINLMGRLVREPELRKTPSGVSQLRFCVAVDRDYKSADGTKQTDFINCVAWRATADFIHKYFHKGDPILMSGRLEISSYTDKDGNKRTAAEVNVDNTYFCGGKSDRSAAPASAGIDVTPTFTELDDEDDGTFPWDTADELPL